MFNETDYLRMAISDSEVARFLKQQGYTYVQFMTGYLFPSAIADINRDFYTQSPIEVSVERDELTASLLDTRRSLALRRISDSFTNDPF